MSVASVVVGVALAYVGVAQVAALSSVTSVLTGAISVLLYRQLSSARKVVDAARADVLEQLRSRDTAYTPVAPGRSRAGPAASRAGNNRVAHAKLFSPRIGRMIAGPVGRESPHRPRSPMGVTLSSRFRARAGGGFGKSRLDAADLAGEERSQRDGSFAANPS